MVLISEGLAKFRKARSSCIFSFAIRESLCTGILDKLWCIKVWLSGSKSTNVVPGSLEGLGFGINCQRGRRGDIFCPRR